MYLLTYEWQHPVDSLSGPGWCWDVRDETLDTQEEAQEHLDRLHHEIGKERHHWEHSSPKWRSDTFIPPYRNFQLHRLTEEPIDSLLDHAQKAHKEGHAQAEAERRERLADHERQERAKLAQLQAKYPEGEVSP